MKKYTLIALSYLMAMTAFAAEPASSPELHGQLREIAGKYLKSQLVNPGPMVAPTRCWRPPTEVLLSEAKKEQAHGGKLFYLFAKDAESLRQKEKVKIQLAGQFLVKETWEAVPVPKGNNHRSSSEHASGQYLANTVMKDGFRLTTGKPKDLYIMLKQSEASDDNDAGWIYAVLSRDGQTVHKAGRIQSCIDCHEDAKHDRILGNYAQPTWGVK